MTTKQEFLNPPNNMTLGNTQSAESLAQLDSSSGTSGKYDLSYFGVNALRYITGNRECPECNFTTRLDHFDPRLVLVHGDYGHLRLTIEEMRIRIASR